MALAVDSLANLLLDQTRVLSNGPILGANDPLRIEVIPGAPADTQITEGGAVFSAVSDGITGGIKGATSVMKFGLEALGVAVSYELQQLKEDAVTKLRELGEEPKAEDWEPMPEGTYKKVPVAADAIRPEFLAAAFLLIPRVKFVRSKNSSGMPTSADELATAVPNLAGGLPVLDHRLVVTLTVGAKGHVKEDAQGNPIVTNGEPEVEGDQGALAERTLYVPFTRPVIRVAIPVCPAAAVLANGPNGLGLAGSAHCNLLIAPGGPTAKQELVSTLNQVIDLLGLLTSLASAATVLVSPLKKLISLLNSLPVDTEIYTTDHIADFSDDAPTVNIGGGFDNKMRSFLLVAPTGVGLRFCSGANLGAWDDFGGHAYRSYKAIDILQLPNSEVGLKVAEAIGIDLSLVGKLAAALTMLTGVPVNEIKLGFGVFMIADYCDTTLPASMKDWEDAGTHGALWPDTNTKENGSTVESARWIGG